MTKNFFPLAIVLAIFVLMFATFPFSVRAEHDWGYIKISPESGHWNYPGYFVLEAERDVTVSWVIKCTYGGCDRPDEDVTTYTFAAGEKISVGWGHQCYAWQLDPLGRDGFIAEAEPELCNQSDPTPVATATQVTPVATPTATAEVPATTPETPTATPDTPTVTPDTLTPTADTPAGTPASTPEGPLTPEPTITVTETPAPSPAAPTSPDPKQELILPVTGELPPSSPLTSPLWPALAALLLLGLAGRTVWAGILQSANAQTPSNLYPVLRSQARHALILILLSLLILAFLVLPPILRQAALDFRDPSSFSLQAPALVQELPPNFTFAPVDQEPLLGIQKGPQALDKQLTDLSQPLSPGEGNPPDGIPVPHASVGANRMENRADTSPVTRLVIPDLKVDSTVYYIPFENKTWDIQELGMDIAWLGNTSSPGLGSNTVLAGHITVLYQGNGLFRYLYLLKPGDLVYVHTTWNVYTYSVREQAVVTPNDSRAVGPTDQSQITLLTCTGWDEQARQYTHRRAVYADLVSVSPSFISKMDDGSKRE